MGAKVSNKKYKEPIQTRSFSLLRIRDILAEFPEYSYD